MKSILLALLVLGVTVSCSKKEEFAPKKIQAANPIANEATKDIQTCADYSLIKPKVDFLFLWDNSSSQLFVNDATKKALNDTVNYISSDFDYHIMIAPLLGAGNQYSALFVDSDAGLTSDAKSLIYNQAFEQQKQILTIKIDRVPYIIHLEKILYIEKVERKTVIHTIDQKYETNESLEGLFKRLDQKSGQFLP